MRNISTIPKNIFIYGCSLGGSSFELLKHLDTTIVSLFFHTHTHTHTHKKKKRRKKKREKEREREDIHNQSINHWCPTHLSCISEGLYG